MEKTNLELIVEIAEDLHPGRLSERKNELKRIFDVARYKRNSKPISFTKQRTHAWQKASQYKWM